MHCIISLLHQQKLLSYISNNSGLKAGVVALCFLLSKNAEMFYIFSYLTDVKQLIEANHSAKIHNISGSVLSQFNLNKETTEISLENLVQGIYFLTIENEKGVSITKKIIKK